MVCAILVNDGYNRLFCSIAALLSEIGYVAAIYMTNLLNVRTRWLRAMFTKRRVSRVKYDCLYCYEFHYNSWSNQILPLQHLNHFQIYCC
jgi:hypothetical protein